MLRVACFFCAVVMDDDDVSGKRAVMDVSGLVLLCGWCVHVHQYVVCECG